MLSLLKMIGIQKTQPELLSKLVLSDPLLDFLNQTILGFIYGIENSNQQDTLQKFSIPKILKKKNTLLFDLDETLITSNIDPSKSAYTFSLSINESIQEFHIAFRPFAKEMIEYLSQYYEIIIFTASHIDYARKIIEKLDPQQKYITSILDRSYCYQTTHGVYIKDLTAFTNLDLQSTLIIDNSSLSYCFQPKNGVPIVTWNGNENDRELVMLAEYLKKLQEGDGDIVRKHENLFSVKLLLNLYNNLKF